MSGVVFFVGHFVDDIYCFGCERVGAVLRKHRDDCVQNNVGFCDVRAGTFNEHIFGMQLYP